MKIKTLIENLKYYKSIGSTEVTLDINDLLNDKNNGVPIKFCLDVDHGDLSSKNKNDYDPYSWIKKIGNESPVIHLKQKTKDIY